MEAKLIKNELPYGYLLYDEKGDLIASTIKGYKKQPLSLKNCEAIELGYDLDELVKGFIERTGYNDFDSYSYKLGFQKALEILGDKKFSEEDILDAWEDGKIKKHPLTKEKKENLLKSLQQTEWEVIVEMEKVPNMDYKPSFGGGSDSHYNPMYVSQPKLDADGCLILKRL